MKIQTISHTMSPTNLSMRSSGLFFRRKMNLLPDQLAKVKYKVFIYLYIFIPYNNIKIVFDYFGEFA